MRVVPGSRAAAAVGAESCRARPTCVNSSWAFCLQPLFSGVGPVLGPSLYISTCTTGGDA